MIYMANEKEKKGFMDKLKKWAKIGAVAGMATFAGMSQAEASNNQPVIDDGGKIKFEESLKVAQPMSDAEFWKKVNEAKAKGEKITDPAMIAKFQQMRRNSIMAKRAATTQQRQNDGQER